MPAESRDLSELREENRLLRQAITEARGHLDNAVTQLRDVLTDEMIVEAASIEAEVAMQRAADSIDEALSGLAQAIDNRNVKRSPIPGGPTRQQGQVLAYIRDYMKLNHGAAPTHAELQSFFRLTPPSVNSMLKRLDERGFIRRTPGKARAIELTIDPELIPNLEQPFN